ncbi:MAG: flagellar assembly protein FliW [Gemmatimonadaceae bacterium]
MTAGTVESTGSITLHSELLGALPVPADQLVEFPEGVYGFPQATRFALLPTPREGLFWLQSVEYSALVFLLVDPFPLFAHFHIDLTEVDKARLGTTSVEDILVLAIVTMSGDQSTPCTANLHAPILLNARRGQGHQSIRTDDGFGIREEFAL